MPVQNLKNPPQAKGIRDPGVLPNIMGKLDPAEAAIRRGDPEIQKVVLPLLQAIREAFMVQQTLNGRLWFMRGSLPAKHGDTHLPDAGDSLTVGVPSGLDNSNVEGTLNSFVRQDHRHKRDVRWQLAGVDIGTRNKSNIISGATLVDNPGTDAVDITITATDDEAIAMAFMGL